MTYWKDTLMSQSRFALCLIPLLLIGCAQTNRSDPADKCQPSTPVTMNIPEGYNGEQPAPKEKRPFLANADRSILWLSGEPFVAGQETKRWWYRPSGADLIVTGKRIDGDAPPAMFRLSPGPSYPHRFMAGLVTFPTEGCWEVTAKAGQSEARWIVRVNPAPARTAADDAWTISQPEMARVPVDAQGQPGGQGELHAWYINSDRSIWMALNPPLGKGRIKVGWFRPPHTLLTLSGRRLDGDAPPLKTETENFMASRQMQPSALTFPSGGVWEITAKTTPQSATQHEAKFVIKVPENPVP
jgi:hypothetical protein